MCMLVLISFVAPCHKRIVNRTDSLTTSVTRRGAIRYTVRKFTGIWFWVKCTITISMLLAAFAGLCAPLYLRGRARVQCARMLTHI